MNNPFPFLIEAAVLLGITLVCSLLARGAARRGGVRQAGALLAAPLLVIALSAGFYAVAAHLPALAACLPEAWTSHRKAWLAFWIVVLAVRALESGSEALYRTGSRQVPVPHLLRSILRAAVYVGAVFLILSRILGMNITPLLTSTALLTAVVGFALQGVLGNLLAGMSLHLVRAVTPRDWVAIGENEGQVVETNWRETRLKTVSGQTLIIPNSRVADSVIHNMSQPDPLRRHGIDVGASYSDRPDEVIATLLEAAASVPDVLKDPPPSAVVTEYKDFGINYRLRFWTRRFHERTVIDGNVNRMIWYKFKRRGIEIPFPMSDKLLNDFMAVVYRQRKMPPESADVERRVEHLAGSEFLTKTLADSSGRPLIGRDEVRGLAPGLRHIYFTGGETVFRQGDPGESCYVVTRGKVCGRIEQDGLAAPVVFEQGVGSVVGEMSLMTGLPRSATITCPEETELLEVSREAFVQLLALRPEIPERLSHLVAERAARNAEEITRHKAQGPAAAPVEMQQPSILQRFLRLLHGD